MFDLKELGRVREVLYASIVGIEGMELIPEYIYEFSTCNGNCIGRCQGTCDDTCEGGCRHECGNCGGGQ